ncbi:hypothetical protein [Pseudomonas sp. FW300-N2A2]|uniref:hypothetical protein n=1 Tax=Pseudomonas sp. FW300-N2A2 TaxID=2751316 RepID=UPI001A925CD5|nr:hypothetical protein [Pseudomonas sp. FW300-N2A2]
MSNDLVESLSGGELQPYSPGESLAPVDSWTQNTDVDLLHERQHAPRTLTFFGTPLATGVTEAHVQATLNELSTLFLNDMGALKYPANLIGFAAKYFMDSALKPPRPVRAIHNFELPSELASDWMANDFCNCLENIRPGTKRQKQQFLTAAITWLAKLAKHVSKTPDAGQGALSTRMSPSNVDPTASLTDQQFNQLLAHNEQVKAQTLQRLAAKYGEYGYQQVVQQAQQYLESLPAIERQHFDKWTGSWPWTHFMNSFEGIDGLYGMAIGINSIGSGADIANEIRAFEAMLAGPDRAKYFKDPQLQNRYRELLRRRDGR